MKQILVYSIVLLMATLGCERKQCTCSCPDPNKLKNLNYTDRRKILVDGNQEFYRKFLSERAFNIPENVLFYSLVMAHEFQDPAAYYDVYILTNIALDKGGVGTKFTKIIDEFALPYLSKSAEMGFEQAIELLEQKDTNIVQ